MCWTKPPRTAVPQAMGRCNAVRSCEGLKRLPRAEATGYSGGRDDAWEVVLASKEQQRMRCEASRGEIVPFA